MFQLKKQSDIRSNLAYLIYIWNISSITNHKTTRKTRVVEYAFSEGAGLCPEAATGGVLLKTLFLKISQYSQEKTCVRVSF